jgi:hypothetical protein
MLPDMLNDRGSHGCSRITMKGADYFVVMGGNINSNTVTNSKHKSGHSLLPKCLFQQLLEVFLE